MTAADDVVRRCWRDIAGTGYEHTADLLVARHTEPHRRYHTAEHVRWVLHHIAHLIAVEVATDHVDVHVHVDVDAVRAAALFHDVVYDPRSATNEADSAAIAERALAEIGWSTARLSSLRDLVLATAGHEADTPGAAVLLDADLAVLGAEPSDYRAYVQGVRAEYDFVDEVTWRAGRAAVLRSFLARDRIYVTASMAAAREQAARRNLEDELAILVSDAAR